MNRSTTRMWDNPRVYLLFAGVFALLFIFVSEVLLNNTTLKDIIIEVLLTPLSFLAMVAGFYWIILLGAILYKLDYKYPDEWKWRSSYTFSSWFKIYYEVWKPMRAAHPELARLNKISWLSFAVCIFSVIAEIVYWRYIAAKSG